MRIKQSLRRLVLPIAVFALVRFPITQLAAWGFGALFAAWGLTSANLGAAPAWAQLVVRAHTALSVLLAVSIATVCAVWTSGTRPERHGGRPVRALPGALLCAALPVGMAFLLDSVRVDSGPYLLPEQPIGLCAQLAVGAATALLIACTAGRDDVPVPVRWTAAAVLGLLFTRSLVQPPALLNAVLTGIACLAVYRAAGLRGALLLATLPGLVQTLLAALPGDMVYCTPVLRLYHVSDALLTGGNGGMQCGLWLTLALLLTIIGTLVRDRRRTK